MNLDETIALFIQSRSQRLKWEKIEEALKPKLHEIMNELDTDTISSDDYTVSRRYQTREFISKEELPPRIWDRYAYASTFPVFYVSNYGNLRL